MAAIPDAYRDLVADSNPLLLFLATTMPDGGPQVTPVWFNYDGEYLLVNSARGRVKDRNVRARPRVACLIMDPENDARFLHIRGVVVAITEAGAEDHGRMLAQRYAGSRERDYTGVTRVIYKIRLDSVTAVG